MYDMARKSKFIFSSDTEDSGINITPLIDVVFVVLIMFIIIAPMLELDRIALSPAFKQDEALVHDVRQSSPLSIYVHQDNSIWVGSQNVPKDKLLSLLREYKKKYPEKTPQVFQDKKAFFETYQFVKGTLETCGFEEMDVILQPGG